MTDRYNGLGPSQLVGPYVYGFAVVASDVYDLPEITRAVYVGITGDVTVLFARDASETPITFKDWPAGKELPLRVKRVMATGTTATNIVGVV